MIQHLLALSISARVSGKRAGLFLKDYTPNEIFDLMGGNSLKTVVHAEPFYGTDPMAAAEKIMGLSDKLGFEIISILDESYPTLLREIDSPPIILYCSRRTDFKDCFSIVGTRMSDRISEKIAFTIARLLSESGYTIISGLAAGIDRFAHLGALKGGCTVGVMAGGIDQQYPPSNRDIYTMIRASQSSAFITEIPPFIKGQKWSFVRRNRIISGLSRWTLVVQAGDKSGAMITARCALEQNREVMVCPGNTFDQSYYGCARLIRQGAALISSIDDVFEEMGIKKSMNNSQSEDLFLLSDRKPKIKEDHDIISAIKNNNLNDIDSISRLLNMKISDIAEAVTLLEIQGELHREGNKIFLNKKLFI
ncbi:MAG: DNA-processing protein DprA [Spirochaetes bacterium]|nr:DNA-processing protein DprA [Spirochaetota bacterium]